MEKTKRHILLTGRNHVPLTDEDIRRAILTFLGMEPTVNVRYDPSSPTVFQLATEASGEEYGEIVFGHDIYPGTSITPNSSLSLTAAAAHELTHYFRWRDKTELPVDELRFLDEALTSFEAILRYERHLSPHDIRQLISDGIQRLQLHINVTRNPSAAT